MPAKNPRDALASLRTLTPRLNAVTDLANNTIRDVEKFLNDEVSAGVAAFVLVEHLDEDGTTWVSLEYRRVGGRFRIALVWYDCGEEKSEKAWADCGRRDKLVSFAKLPDLLTEIAKKVEAYLGATEATARTVAASFAKPKQGQDDDIQF